MPTLSCPRCCRAYRPRYVRFAASLLPCIPKTPHSSLNLSAVYSFISGNTFREVTGQAVLPAILGFGRRAIDGDFAADSHCEPIAAGASDDRGRKPELSRLLNKG